MSRSRARNNPFVVHAALALALAAAGALGLWWGVSGQPHWLPLLACWLVAVNVIAFGYYGYDKRCAGTDRCRVPELVLHGLSAAGGSVGAYAGMSFFRHKTMKGRFRILFWCIVALQAALGAWALAAAWRG